MQGNDYLLIFVADYVFFYENLCIYEFSFLLNRLVGYDAILKSRKVFYSMKRKHANIFLLFAQIFIYDKHSLVGIIS